MSKPYKAASSAGAVALVLSGSVLAAAPAFDSWTVSNGTIAGAACGSGVLAGFSCGTAMTDLGFYQRMVTETSTGQQYFQTIITENNATAAGAPALDALVFADESFVRTGNVNGIADKQRISQVSASTTFKASTTLNSGWAGESLKLTQTLNDTSDSFQTDFIFRQEGSAATSPSGVTATGMKITAYVPIQGADKQDFVLVDLSGDYARIASNVAAGKSTVTLPATPTNLVMSWTNDTVKGGSAAAPAGVIGDRVQAVWIGQDLSTIVGQTFGFTSYDNKTTVANDFISTFSLSNMAAVAWDTGVWGARATTGTITDPFQPWP